MNSIDAIHGPGQALLTHAPEGSDPPSSRDLLKLVTLLLKLLILLESLQKDQQSPQDPQQNPTASHIGQQLPQPPSPPVPEAPAAPPAAPASPAPASPAAPGGEDMTPREIMTNYKDEIARASSASGVPPEILAGMIWQESKGRPNTPGGGLMQLGPHEFQQYGGGDIQNAGDNIMAGAMYMKDLIGQFGSIGPALRAYNSGPNGVDINNLNATPAGTGDPTYVDKVLQAAREAS